LKIDAQLCIVIKSTIHSSLKQNFRTYETCSKVWEQAKLLYTNDTQRRYGVCQNLLTVVAPKRLDGTMTEYLSKVHSLLHDFNELLPPAPTPSQELEQNPSSSCYGVYMAFLMIILMFVIKFCDLLLCPISLPPVLPFCMCQINTPLI